MKGFRDGTCLAACQHVHESGLASSRHAHKASKALWAEGASDVMQQRQLRLRGALHTLARFLLTLRAKTEALKEPMTCRILHGIWQ